MRITQQDSFRSLRILPHTRTEQGGYVEEGILRHNPHDNCGSDHNYVTDTSDCTYMTDSAFQFHQKEFGELSGLQDNDCRKNRSEVR